MKNPRLLSLVAVASLLSMTPAVHADPANDQPVVQAQEQPAQPANGDNAAPAAPEGDRQEESDEEAAKREAEEEARAREILEGDDLRALIDYMGEVSRKAEAGEEQLKQLEDELKISHEQVEDYQRQVDVAREEAEAATAKVVAAQQEIDRIALAKYRGAHVDPITTVISAGDPQRAIDRTAYLQSLSRRTEMAVKKLEVAAAEAEVAHSEAIRVKDDADHKVETLAKRKEDLDRKREALEKRKEEIRAKVDAMEEEEREAWVHRNGPTHNDVDIESVVGENPLGVSAAQAALTKIGSPYSWGATGPGAFDCSGLMVWAYAQQGKGIPRTSQAQMAGGAPVSRSQLQPGDIIGYYPGATHVGMYIGDGKVVHASDYGIPVQVVGVDSMPFYGARRY